MAEPSGVREFYEGYDEDARLASRHGQVEFLTTMSYVGRYLPAGGRVLDVGAGTGRYSHALARRGHRVDAVELVERNIEAFRARTGPGEDVTVVQGDARDLGRFPDDAYDVTLLLGPLYHLHGAGDKRRALSEAARVTRPGGVVLAAHVVSDGCLVDLGFSRGEIDVAAYVRDGLLDAGTFASVSRDGDVFDLVRREDTDALLGGLPVERLHYVASDGLAPLIAESIDAMGDEAFDLFMRWHLATCERGDFVGLTSHSLDVLRVL